MRRNRAWLVACDLAGPIDSAEGTVLAEPGLAQEFKSAIFDDSLPNRTFWR